MLKILLKIYLSGLFNSVSLSKNLVTFVVNVEESILSILFIITRISGVCSIAIENTVTTDVFVMLHLWIFKTPIKTPKNTKM